MTPQEKIEILQKMRELIEIKNYAGFCKAYSGATHETSTNEKLYELGLAKPIGWDSYYPYWYSPNDKQTRLTKIDEAISKHQSNNMNNNEIQREIETRRKNIEAETAKLKELEGKLKEESKYFDFSDIKTSFSHFNTGDTNIKHGVSIQIMSVNEYKNKGFWLDSERNWEIVTDTKGHKVLIPTRK